MANRDLFAGGDYQRPKGAPRPVTLAGRMMLQGLAALLLFAGVVYLYDQESSLGEGVRYVVALATSEQQEAMAVNGLGDLWRNFKTPAEDKPAGTESDNNGDDTNDNTDDKQGDNNAQDNKAENLPADSTVLPSTTEYHPDEDYLAASKLNDEGEPILVLPASGLMQSAFGELSEDGLPVGGLEIFCQQEQAVKAAAIGEVTEVSPGKQITLKHSGGMETVYSGDIAAEVKKGDVLRQGEVIGRITEGVLLFRVLVEGEPQDPLLYVAGPK